MFDTVDEVVGSAVVISLNLWVIVFPLQIAQCDFCPVGCCYACCGGEAEGAFAFFAVLAVLLFAIFFPHRIIIARILINKNASCLNFILRNINRIITITIISNRGKV